LLLPDHYYIVVYAVKTDQRRETMSESPCNCENYQPVVTTVNTVPQHHSYTKQPAAAVGVTRYEATTEYNAFVSVWAPENEYWFYVTPEQARRLAIRLLTAAEPTF
jgi:hypothetical protein